MGWRVGTSQEGSRGGTTNQREVGGEGREGRGGKGVPWKVVYKEQGEM